DLETVILKAMAKSREERYATAQELADDLRCVLEGKPTHARPPTMGDRLVKWSRRHRRLVAGTLAALVLVCLGLATTTLLVVREQRQTAQNLALAKRYFGDSTETIVDVVEELGRVPGAEELRYKVLRNR